VRLVAWNANYNAQRLPLEESVTFLETLHADVLVLSEVPPPTEDNPLRAQWIGERAPGLAVIAGAGLELEAHPANAGAPPLMGAFTVSGRGKFDLMACWPVKRDGGPDYHQILMAGLERYEDVLRTGHTILAGDLNSSTRVTSQRRSHPAFVERAGDLGLVSAYHLATGEVHGGESVPTYLHGPGESGQFHIDYCFVPERLAEAVSIEVLADDTWADRSDHFPVVLDVEDGALSC
jgi:endonuclease/exonuclease/phosphatase family metal-dependent hydrolase